MTQPQNVSLVVWIIIIYYPKCYIYLYGNGNLVSDCSTFACEGADILAIMHNTFILIVLHNTKMLKFKGVS